MKPRPLNGIPKSRGSGSDFGQYYLAEMYENGYGLKNMMTRLGDGIRKRLIKVSKTKILASLEVGVSASASRNRRLEEQGLQVL